MVSAETEARLLFAEHFGGEPVYVVRAPGRVNLMGDHTDYNDGFVLPMAIDRGTWIALRPISDRRVNVVSSDFGRGSLRLDELRHGEPAWLEYVRGTAWALGPEGLIGWQGAVASDLPQGAGLSSSASFELATARAFAAASGSSWNAREAALAAQRGENEWVGMACGVMDQLTAAAGRAGHALLIDCRSLDITPVPLPAETTVVVLDTRRRRRLVDSAYNDRRSACERAAAAWGVAALRDLTAGDLAGPPPGLDEVTLRRVRHVVSENRRTQEAATALAAGDLAALGRLMAESHASLRDDYEVSTPELDAMVEAAGAAPGFIGARMTGAGFGGAVVALVRAGEADSFMAAALDAYRTATGAEGESYLCVAADGAELID